MRGFSIFSKAKNLRVELCCLAYRMGLARRVSEGEITPDEAADLWEVAEDNIRTFGLTLNDHPIQFAITGVDKQVVSGGTIL